MAVNDFVIRESNGEIPTNYTHKYAETRGWKEWEIVREFVQNSLDSTGTVSIEKLPDKLLITDRGKGFNAVNLLMGTTTKSECHRGRFGEGMKIACLAALNLGYEVEIFTDSMHIVPIFKTLKIEEPSGGTTEAEILVFRYNKIAPEGGTKVLIKGYTGDTYLDRFNLETNKKIVLKKDMDMCEDKWYPSYIIDEPVKRIYVRNIYVQEITDSETAETKPALYSYDLFAVRLSTDRNIPNTADIDARIGYLWSMVTDQRMIEAFFKQVQDEGFEAQAKISGATIKSHGSKSAWVSAFKAVYGDNAFISTSENNTRLAEYNSKFMKKGVKIPYSIRNSLNALDIPLDIEILEQIKSIRPRSPIKLEQAQYDNMQYMRDIHEKLKVYYPKLKGVYLGTMETMLDAEGKARDGQIYIREDMAKTMVHMIDVYGHEATHIAYPELEDNTSAFYSKIGVVMATITKVIVQDMQKEKPPAHVVW
jgi:hypothetical protein